MPTLMIDCDECAMQGTDQCNECVVTFLCDRDPDEVVMIEADEARVVGILSRAGLVPNMQHRRAAG